MEEFQSKHKKSELDEDIFNVKHTFDIDGCQSFSLAN